MVGLDSIGVQQIPKQDIVKLTEHTYLLWKHQVTLVIDAYGLLRYISNTADVPGEFVTDGQRVENSAFVLFRQQDKLLASWILTTVSMDVLPHVTGLISSLAIWNTISRLLERLSSRDVVSWTSIISGSVLCGFMHEALLAFFKMQEDGVAPKEVTIMSSLHACSFIGRLRIL
ncbi:pentatricopeptide repeat-containing protein At5g39350-like [Hibiscus syriacus]|uniref:pentatricopeptide repeat-containing protein At5g39350-like n=1 Tax=Hibiscus syriacus TaxID=106335 RepID=UPI0019221C2D|nr:pentatricopeptide repeat-containing protein At5g39350-like [Hibiscus syriacus]